MKIGLFTDTYTPQINGVVTVVQMMLRGFRALGHDPIVFAPSYPDQPEVETGVWRFPSKKLAFHPESRLTWPYRRKVPRVLSELDVIHSHTPFSLGLLAVWASRRYGMPHVHTYHTFFTEYRHYIPRPLRPTKRGAERYSSAFCNRCQLVLTPSEEMKAELDTYDINVPIEARPFGIDLDAFDRPEVFDLRAELGLEADTLVLLTAGRLGPEKNFGFLLESLARIRAERDGVVLVIAGDGPSRNDLEAQAEALGLSSAVHFLGYVARERLIDGYRQADLFVFASKTETQGIVLLEAQAAGTPVIAIGEMGVNDVVDHGQSGLLLEDDVEAFSLAVLELLGDEARRRAMRVGALRLAADHSAQESCVQLAQIYDQLRRREAVVSY